MTQETALMVAPKVLAIAPKHGRCLEGDVGIPQDNFRGRVCQIKVCDSPLRMVEVHGAESWSVVPNPPWEPLQSVPGWFKLALVTVA